MARKVLQRGNAPNDHPNAESFYSAAGKINDMTLDLYSLQSQILSAGDARFADPVLYPTTESKIDAMLTQCESELKTIGAIPANMIPHDTTLIGTHPTVRRVREGGDYSVYDVQAYGADQLGVANASPAFQVCETARALANGQYYIPPGTYRIDTTVTAASDSIFWQGTPASVLVCNVSTGPAVDFSRAGNFIKYLQVNGLRVNAGVAGHRQPLLAFGRSGQSLSRFAVRNVILDAVHFNRDGIRVIDSFDGLFVCVTFENFENGGPAIRVETPTLNTGQLKFDTCQSTTNPFLFLINENPQGNAMSGMHIDNCKLARRADLGTNKFTATTVNGAHSIGATAINVAAGQGVNFAAGDWIIVDNVAQTWVDKVASVSVDAINLTATLPIALANGDRVVVGNFHTIAGHNTKGLTLTVPQFERCNGVFGGGAFQVRVNDPLVSAECKRVAYLANLCQGWRIERPIYFFVPLSSDVVLHQSAGVSNQQNEVVGPVKSVTTYPTIIQRDGGTMVSFKGRASGLEQLLGVWHQDTAVAANQTNVQITGPNGAVRSLAMPSAGTMYALNVRVSSPRTNGTLTATVYKGGVAQTLTAVIDGSNTQNKLTEFFHEQQFGFFSPGNVLDVRITTDASWAPTANDVDVQLYVSQ